MRDWIEGVARELANARRVHVSLDTVIFDDGLLIGAARSQLAPHFHALVQARQDGYRTVLQQVETGAGIEDVVQAFVRPDPSDADRMDREYLAQNEAQHAVAALLRDYGSEALPDILRRAILSQPFTIWRRGAT